MWLTLHPGEIEMLLKIEATHHLISDGLTARWVMRSPSSERMYRQQKWQRWLGR